MYLLSIVAGKVRLEVWGAVWAGRGQLTGVLTFYYKFFIRFHLHVIILKSVFMT